jgi:small-conductance mechanosensitive channel
VNAWALSAWFVNISKYTVAWVIVVRILVWRIVRDGLVVLKNGYLLYMNKLKKFQQVATEGDTATVRLSLQYPAVVAQIAAENNYAFCRAAKGGASESSSVIVAVPQGGSGSSYHE